MPDCPICGKPLESPMVKCSSCNAELHRACAKRTMGKSYCKDCYKQAKKQARFERMVQHEALGREKPGRMW
ncbi:MAG: hypothetical protein AVW05_00430 [Hadesarchaea archaeon DG-33]|nr:MAG: hypothetical protein AVW05_00430 [Hadesarchaea archaeon DG-33]